jgi:putative transposase
MLNISINNTTVAVHYGKDVIKVVWWIMVITYLTVRGFVLNPVRASIVKHPEDFVYSSYHANALGKPDPMLTPHCEFEAFIGSSNGKSIVSGNENVSESKKTDSDTCNEHRHLYIELCKEALDRETLINIRRGTEKGLGIGQANFLLKIASLC